MGLKQSIIIKSEYTNNARSKAGKGSRGATPGQYVMRYMAREDATEVLAPVKNYDSDGFTRYMVRNDATEALKDETFFSEDDYQSPLRLKHRFKKHDKLSGRAFGSKGLSLSQEALETSSNDIQEAFDQGHSVQKIILSFTEEYLRETGVLDEDFEHKGRGSYKGHIDQLKLREAITRGVDDMTKTGAYASPLWVGTIQLDTNYVHAHIALVDEVFSERRMRNDGADQGKINEKEKYMFRRGINFALEDMRDLKSFHKQASVERQNVTAFVKNFAYSTIQNNSEMQLLLASLPKDKKDWRYASRNKNMKHANTLAVDIVEGLFERDPDGSGYTAAMKSVQAYADESRVKNRLDDEAYQKVLDTGRNQLLERSVNGMYSRLKDVDASELHVSTPMIDIQSTPDEDLVQALQLTDDFDPAAFELRVRGYRSRRKSHQKDVKTFRKLADEYDRADNAGLVDASADVMRGFYESEMRYHMAVTDKYRKLMHFNHPKDRFNKLRMSKQHQSLMKRFDRIVEKEQMTGFQDEKSRDAYKEDLRAYTLDCFDKGVAAFKDYDAITDYDPKTGVSEIKFVTPPPPKLASQNLDDQYFNQVKALDIHHLGLDYYNKLDVNISEQYITQFANVYEDRKVWADLATIYAEDTHQQLDVLTASRRDLIDMADAVDVAVNQGMIRVITPDAVEQLSDKQGYTIPVDKNINIQEAIKKSLEYRDEDMRRRERIAIENHDEISL